MTLANLAAFRLLWLPSRRKIVARSLSCSRHFAVPAEAVLIGTFERPIAAADIVRDLEELLERLPEPAPLPEPDHSPPACEAGDGEAIAAEDGPTPSPSHPWRYRPS